MKILCCFFIALCGAAAFPGFLLESIQRRTSLPIAKYQSLVIQANGLYLDYIVDVRRYTLQGATYNLCRQLISGRVNSMMKIFQELDHECMTFVKTFLRFLSLNVHLGIWEDSHASFKDLETLVEQVHKWADSITPSQCSPSSSSLYSEYLYETTAFSLEYLLYDAKNWNDFNYGTVIQLLDKLTVSNPNVKKIFMSRPAVCETISLVSRTQNIIHMRNETLMPYTSQRWNTQNIVELCRHDGDPFSIIQSDSVITNDEDRRDIAKEEIQYQFGNNAPLEIYFAQSPSMHDSLIHLPAQLSTSRPEIMRQGYLFTKVLWARLERFKIEQSVVSQHQLRNGMKFYNRLKSGDMKMGIDGLTPPESVLSRDERNYLVAPACTSTYSMHGRIICGLGWTALLSHYSAFVHKVNSNHYYSVTELEHDYDFGIASIDNAIDELNVIKGRAGSESLVFKSTLKSLVTRVRNLFEFPHSTRNASPFLDVIARIKHLLLSP